MIAFHDFSDHIHQLILQAVALRTYSKHASLPQVSNPLRLH